MIILSDVCQQEKDKYHMISLICGTYSTDQMNLSMKQKQNHAHREWTGSCYRGGEQEKAGSGV